jgi:hypothetical protein
MNRTTHGGVTRLIRLERTPKLAPKSLKKLSKFRVVWSYPSTNFYVVGVEDEHVGRTCARHDQK